MVVSYYSSSTGPRKGRITAEENLIIRKESLDGSFSSYEPWAKTVSELYAFIYERYNSYKNEPRGDSLRLNITYNKEFHYLEYADFGIYYNTPTDGGGGWTVKLTEFEPL